MISKRYEDDKLYRFHWRHREPDEGYGRDAADAFSRLGFGAGATRALDSYEEVTPIDAALKEKPE